MNIRTLLIVPLLFSGCITSSVNQKAKTDRQHQKALSIREAYADDSGNITINFRAKLSNSKGTCRCM